MTADEPVEPTDAMDAVQGHLDAIQRRRRSKIRWQITKHTAELAIAALAEPKARGARGKPRRRSRRKRLL